jgi:hypothetical protein
MTSAVCAVSVSASVLALVRALRISALSSQAVNTPSASQSARISMMLCNLS